MDPTLTSQKLQHLNEEINNSSNVWSDIDTKDLDYHKDLC